MYVARTSQWYVHFSEKKRSYLTNTEVDASKRNGKVILAFEIITRVSRNAVTRDKSTVTTIRASSSTAVASKLVLRYEINLDRARAP